MTTPAPGDTDTFDWSNASVVAFANGRDPMAVMSAVVADLLLRAADAGASTVPTNPLQIAELMGLRVRPHFDTLDARLVPTGPSPVSPPPWPSSVPAASAVGGDRGVGQPGVRAAQEVHDANDRVPLRGYVSSGADLTIEYNPTRPRGRLRYSVAHEIMHALFPDAADDVRNRTHTGAVDKNPDDDSWQLELLCNIGAAELLMPTDAIEGLLDIDTDLDFLMAQRARFNVSTEALLRRLVHATSRPMALAAFHRTADRFDADMRCEYVLGSRSWGGGIARGSRLVSGPALQAPTAVGQTSRGFTELPTGTVHPTPPGSLEATLSTPGPSSLAVQMVGIPPYPGRSMPRLLALLEPGNDVPGAANRVHYVTADILDALNPSPTAGGSTGSGQRRDHAVLIAHVVNDRGHTWAGAGVASVLARALPDAAAAFRAWTVADQNNLSLGSVHLVDVWFGAQKVVIASMVAQAGYGPSATPRLSYVALAEALAKVGQMAARTGMVVHMPRIGAGQAGGRWDLIEATLERTMLDHDIDVVVYTRPSGGGPSRPRTDQYGRQAREQ